MIRYVSPIQTVGNSSDSSCVSTDPSPMNSFFTLDPPVPSTCSIQSVTWNETRYQEPPNIQVLIPGGPALQLDRPTTNTPAFTTWRVLISDGLQAFVFVESATGADSRTSPLFTVTEEQNYDCFYDLGELRSTVIASTVTASTITASPESTKKVK